MFSIANPAIRKLATGEFVLCMAIRQVSTVNVALMVASCGFDALYVDREHGIFSDEAASQLCLMARAVGLTPLVRVKSAAETHIAEALEGGALGVIVPHVQDAAEAEAVVLHAKFPPAGHRSIAAMSSATGYAAMPIAESIQAQNEATMIIAMLETPEAVSNARAIAAVRGIDALMVGPNDLTAALDVAIDSAEQHLKDAYTTISAACRAAGKHWVAGGAGRDLLPMCISLGARFIMGGNDVGYLLSAARRDASMLREVIGLGARNIVS